MRLFLIVYTFYDRYKVLLEGGSISLLRRILISLLVNMSCFRANSSGLGVRVFADPIYDAVVTIAMNLWINSVYVNKL